jgi:predicted RNase H-like nuclease (RuvC/YqgF family)
MTTEINSNWGGYRPKSGRKALPPEAKAQTAVVRVDVALVTVIEGIKAKFKAGQREFIISPVEPASLPENTTYQQTTALTIEDLTEQANLLERLTTENALLKAEKQQLEKKLQKIGSQPQADLTQLQANNERLVIKYDILNEQHRQLQTKLNEAKRQPDQLRAEITRLKHLEHACQCLTKNGTRCNNPAKTTIDTDNALHLHVCLQHYKTLGGK